MSARFDGFWSAQRNALRLDRGWLYARNDADWLYLFVDLTADTGPDRGSGRDYLSLVFDVDGNGRITQDRDIAYGMYRDSIRLGLQRFHGPGRFTGLQPTRAKLAAGFGPSAASQRPHRVWELAIPLAEIGAKAGGGVRLGLRLHSADPQFTEERPPGLHSDFANLLRIQLAGPPMIMSVITARPDLAMPQSQRPRIGAIVGRVDSSVLRRLQPRVVLVPGDAGPSPDCPLPEGEPVDRRIAEGGFVELVYANRSSKRRGQGGWTVYCPDGSEAPIRALFSTQIPPTLPPTLPDGATAEWLDYHGNRLLGIITGLVGDPDMVQRYLDSEGEDWSIYRRIQGRGDTINYLVAE
ncbi:hypothetical protein [Sediminicurvatus halobius]|uniref:hypothetical protein n=1 Tax=Sediminicurvatus halobius TaxID=2182432 RepID=UPI001304BF78|nr:hypothetical protein [Spiribacter halobius]